MSKPTKMLIEIVGVLLGISGALDLVRWVNMNITDSKTQMLVSAVFTLLIGALVFVFALFMGRIEGSVGE